jgi:hypothetical protein
MNILPLIANPEFEKDLQDLLSGTRQGHMGHWEYEAPDGEKLWAEFIARNKAYYIPENEKALIKKLKLSIPAPVTVVSYGGGGNFYCKEAVIARQFSLLKRIVHIDCSPKQLERSVAQGKQIFPDAKHISILADFWEDSFSYPVEGIEICMLFGMTLFNIKGDPNGKPPTHQITRNLKKLKSRMTKDAIFITTNDGNTDKESIEAAYAGQTMFAKNMLRLGNYDTPNVGFEVEYHPESHALAHYLTLPERKCFNNSYKLPHDIFLECARLTGYTMDEKSICDTKGMSLDIFRN